MVRKRESISLRNKKSLDSVVRNLKVAPVGMTEFEIFSCLTNNGGFRMVYHPPLPHLRLERQMLGDEDCLRIENPSSAVATQMRR